VRLKKDVLRTRLKGSIDIEFTEEPLSSYSGLELFRRFTASSGVGNVTAFVLGRPKLRY
jgi:hypothetical protein